MATSDPGIFSKEFSTFVALAQNRSFKATAELFGVSQSSISRHLNDLEQSLHVTLFDRSHNPMVLTAEGRWLLDAIAPSLHRISHAVADVRNTTHFKPYLRIGFIDSFSYDVAPMFVQEMSGRLQGICCLTGGADRLIERMTAQEVDIILTINPCFDIPELRRHLLLSEPSIMIFPKTERFAQADKWSWQQLSLCGLPFIRNYSSSGGGRLESLHFTTHDVRISGTVHSDSIGMRMKMVARGQGWAIIRPLSLLQHLDLYEKLHIFATPKPMIYRDIYVLGRPCVAKPLFLEVISTLQNILAREVVPRLRSLVPPELAPQIRTGC